MMRPLEALEDAELLRRTTAEPQAFAVFYRRYFPGVLRYLHARTGGDRELAADLTAEVFAAALQARRRFSPDRGSAQAWLLTIARNKHVDSVRRGRAVDDARRRAGIPVLEFEDGDLARIDELLGEPDELAERARLLAAELPPEMRAAVDARVIDERDYRQIADAQGCSEALARQRVRRGLARLRAGLEEKP